jgi:nucleoside triphosphatase
LRRTIFYPLIYTDLREFLKRLAKISGFFRLVVTLHYNRAAMTNQTFPEPTVGILIFNSRGELLLLKTHKWLDKYSIPGGHIELGESAVEAARRESKEETGLDVHDVRFLRWQECIYDPQFWKPRHFIFLDFTAKAEHGEVVLNDEAEKFAWIAPQKALEELDIDSYTAVSIREYLSQRGTR